MKTTTWFKLIGLERLEPSGMSATLETSSGNDTFKAPLLLSPERCEALWNFCEHHWDEKKFAQVIHDGFLRGPYPENPHVSNIKLNH